MGNITVIHFMQRGSHAGHHEFIMRPSILSNPFRITGALRRDECLSRYKQHLWKEIKLKSAVFNKLTALAKMDKDIVLICCCKPEPCHGDIVKAAIEWLRKEES